MQKTHLKIKTIILALLSLAVNAASYETLPKGVHTAVFKYVLTDKISSSYGPDSLESTYYLKENLNAKNLENINEAINEYFKRLKGISTVAYNEFSFGEYELEGDGSISVNGYGLGYGVTDRLTVYTSLPVYKANINLNINRTKGNNHKGTLEAISQNSNKGISTNDQLLKDITASLPDAKQELLQSIITNYYGYQPIGNWSATSLGDIDLGAIYRLTNWNNSGIALGGGITIPTGRVDDPDIIQDIGFGDGQVDWYIEGMTGMTTKSGLISFDLKARFTYQMSSVKELRVPKSKAFPLSRDKALFREKLGNKFDLIRGMSYKAYEWLTVTSEVIYNSIQKTKYESLHSEANEILAINSKSHSESLKLNATVSTINLYNQGKIAAPFNIRLSYQKKLSGRNTPKHSLYELDMRIFF